MEKVNQPDKSLYYGTIKALKNYKNKWLLIGNGNSMDIYSIKDEKIIVSVKVFNKKKITDLKILNGKIFIIGQNRLKQIDLKNEDFENIQIVEFKLKSNDYILDIQICDGDKLLIGYALNFIEIYKLSVDSEEQQITYIDRVFCKENCIIYSMAIGEYDIITGTLMIASGSVFTNIIIWILNLNDRLIISNNHLVSHQGVIFRLKFISEKRLLSVSDDRTVKFWTINEIKENVFEYDLLTFFGHTSRVWDVIYIKEFSLIASVSEDSTCRVFDVNTLKCISVIEGHKGKNIRSIESINEFIFTGGEDAQVLKWNVKNLITNNEVNYKAIKQFKSDNLISVNISNESEQYLKMKEMNANFKPNVKAIDLFEYDSKILLAIATNHGQVSCFNIQSKENEIVFNDDNLLVINTLITKLINEHLIIIIGLSNGSISLYDYTVRKLLCNIQIFSNMRICNIFCFEVRNTSYIVTTNPVGQFSIINYNSVGSKVENNLVDTMAKSPIVSCELLNSNESSFTVILGNFIGKVFVYVFNLRDMKQTLIRECKIHQNDKISMILNLGNNKLITASRDGKLKFFNFDYEYNLTEIDSKSINGISSIEWVHISNNKEIIICGFFAGTMKLFNVSTNMLIHQMDIKGINRPLSILFSNKKIIFSYSHIHISYIVDIQCEEKTNSLSLGNIYDISFHGRIIYSISSLTFDEENDLIVTGSEDTTLLIFLRNRSNLKLKFINSISKHTGAVRSVKIINNNDQEFFIVSGGASSELFIHNIKLRKIEGKYTVECAFICNLSKQKENLDCRIMDIDFIQTSKSNFILSVNTLGELNTSNFESFVSLRDIKTNSIQLNSNFIGIALKSIPSKDSVLTFIGYTNGILEIIDIFKLIEQKSSFYKLHEAGINSIGLKRNLKDDSILIFTGGEDSNLVISSYSDQQNFVKLVNLNTFHCSSIKVIKIINNFIISSGYDQKVFIFKQQNDDIKLFKKLNTCVTEVNDLTVIQNDDILNLSVVGQGLQNYQISLSD